MFLVLSLDRGLLLPRVHPLRHTARLTTREGGFARRQAKVNVLEGMTSLPTNDLFQKLKINVMYQRLGRGLYTFKPPSASLSTET